MRYDILRQSRRYGNTIDSVRILGLFVKRICNEKWQNCSESWENRERERKVDREVSRLSGKLMKLMRSHWPALLAHRGESSKKSVLSSGLFKFE